MVRKNWHTNNTNVIDEYVLFIYNKYHVGPNILYLVNFCPNTQNQHLSYRHKHIISQKNMMLEKMEEPLEKGVTFVIQKR